MADMVLGSAQGAVDSLLGRLTSALAGEAQLLSGVRSDVQFIKDEMESMNGFLMHIAETGKGESDHQVRAWMKQVADVAYRSQNNVDLYVKSLGACTTAAGQKGICGYLRRLPQLVKTLPMRHRIATQIRELKIRAREVGERRLRYGVEVPVNSGRGDDGVSMTPSGGDESTTEEGTMAWADIEPGSFESFSLKTWITQDGDDAKLQKQGTPRVIALVGDKEKTTDFVKVALEDPWLTSTCPLDRKEWIQLGQGYEPNQLARRIQMKLSGQPDESSAMDVHLATGDDSATDVTIIRKHLQLLEPLVYTTTTRLANFLLYIIGTIYPKTLMRYPQQKGKGKRFLLVLDDVQETSIWDSIKSVFSDSKWSPDSAILVITQDVKFAYPFIPYEIYILESVYTELHNYSNYVADFYLDNKAIAHQGTHLKSVLKEIFKRLCRQIKERKLFLYALSANPNRTLADLQSLQNSLDYASPNNHKEILKFIYKGLSISFRDCMLYLSIFRGRTDIKRARLVRRWVAEGMITKRGRLSALDEAERCFDVLVSHGCMEPSETDVTGKVKTYGIHDLVTEIARDENIVIDNLTPGLAHRLSIRTALQLQQGAPLQYATPSKASCSWIKFNPIKKTIQPETDESNAIRMFFESLSFSPQLRLLEVLDLEDCNQLKNNHLKSICNNLFKLKYLSIRRTGITKLPKQLGRLLFLETLDIRQTKIETLTKDGSVVLPRLKHLLSTCHNDHRNHENQQSEEPFFTVKMPKSVGTMTELEVLSHMEVSGEGDELEHIGSLHRLRKLGLVINGCPETGSRSLFNAIGQLNTSLRTLSIQIIARNDIEDVDIRNYHSLRVPPLCLQKLDISGHVYGLSLWVQEMKELTKITLHKTLLTADDIEILGRLTSLCYLWLRQEAYHESTLIFKQGRFQSLMFLIIECSEITNISFNKATPKLEKIVWSTSDLQFRSLSGIDVLHNVTEINLKGNFNREVLQQAADANPNKHILKIILNNAWIQDLPSLLDTHTP